MKEQFLSYDLSLRIRQLGFYFTPEIDRVGNKILHFIPMGGAISKDFDVNLLLKAYPMYRKYMKMEHQEGYVLNTEFVISVPLIQQARNFLLEKYGKFPVVYSDGFKWTYDLRWPDPKANFKDPYPGVMFPKNGLDDKREYFDTYQQAELRAIEKIIEFVENEKTE